MRAGACVGAILGWALLLTTVNLVLQALRDRAGLLGNLLLGAAAVAWGLATLLVVPILALEGLGPFAALSRSTALFREKWGEQLAGAASIGVLFAVLGVVPAVVLVSLGVASGSDAVAIALLVVAVLIAVVAGILGSAARAVFAVALYRYAAGAGATGRSGAAPRGCRVQRARPTRSQDRSSAAARLRHRPGGIRSTAVVRTYWRSDASNR